MWKSFARVPRVAFDLVVCLDASFEPFRCVTLLLYLSLVAVLSRQVTAGPVEASAPCSFTFSPPVASVMLQLSRLIFSGSPTQVLSFSVICAVETEALSTSGFLTKSLENEHHVPQTISNQSRLGFKFWLNVPVSGFIVSRVLR